MRTSKITKEEIKLEENSDVKKGRVGEIDSIAVEMLKADVFRIATVLVHGTSTHEVSQNM